MLGFAPFAVLDSVTKDIERLGRDPDGLAGLLKLEAAGGSEKVPKRRGSRRRT